MLLEYQLDWIKIVDFLLIAKIWASPKFAYSPSRRITFLMILTNSLLIEGVHTVFALAKNLAIMKKSTILIQSS